MTNETCYIIKNVGQEYKKIEPTSILSSLTLKPYRMLNTTIFIKQRSKKSWGNFMTFKIATLKRLEKYQEVNFEFERIACLTVRQRAEKKEH